MGAVLPRRSNNDNSGEMGIVCPFIIPETADKTEELTIESEEDKKEKLIERFANLKTLMLLADGSDNMKMFLVGLNNMYSREEIAKLYQALLDKNIIGYQIELLIYNRYRMDAGWFFKEVTSTDDSIVDSMITWINNMSVVYELENKAVKSGALNLKNYGNNPIRFTFTNEERKVGSELRKAWDIKDDKKYANITAECKKYTKRFEE